MKIAVLALCAAAGTSRRGRKSASKPAPAKRRSRKAASVSSDDNNSDLAESDEDSSDASSDEAADTTMEDPEELGLSADEENDTVSGEGSDAAAKRTIIPRDRDPVYVQNRVFPPLQLPASSEDLIIPRQLVLPALGVYEILRRFANSLQLTPFRFEDFGCALMAEENSKLLAEIFRCED